MASIENQEKSMLKLAQFRSFIVSNRKPTEKDLKLILQGLDFDSRVLETSFLKEHNSKLIGCTLLDLAYKNLSIDVFNILIRQGADFTAKNKNGNTVIHEIFHLVCGFHGSSEWDIKKEQSHLIDERSPFLTSIMLAHVKYKNTSNPSDPSGLSHFHVACATNNIEAVKFFLSHRVPVNQPVVKAISNEYFEGYTALHFAAHFGYIEVIEILLRRGADVNLKDTKRKTPLHISLERNIRMIDSAREIYSSTQIMSNQKIMSLLFIRADNTEFSTLHVDSARQDSYLTKHVPLEANNINQYICMNSQNWPGYTALHFAAHVNVNIVVMLVLHGADIKAKAADGVTPFDLCIDRYKAEDIVDVLSMVPKWKNVLLSDSRTKLIDLLYAFKDSDAIKSFLEKSFDGREWFVPMDSTLWPGFTVLHIGVLLSERTKCKSDYKTKRKYRYFEPDLSVVTEILKQGADVSVKDFRNWTPIHFAFRLGKTKTLDLLLEYHHETENFVDDENLSHLHIACAAGNKDLVEKLFCNTDVNVAYNGDSPVSCVYPGWTPLHVAVYKRDFEMTKLLLKIGANVHAIDKCGFTPMHDLLPREFSEILFSTSDLHDVVVKDLGLSYLHVACFSLNVNAVERLLSLGTDVNKVITCKIKQSSNKFMAEAYDGWTPLHCALNNLYTASPSRLQIVNLLIERGADLLIEDSKKISPLSMILESGVNEFLKVVVKALKGSDDLINRVERKTGVTMLHIACSTNDMELIKELLDAGVNANAQILNDSLIWPGFTALHVLILSFDDFVADGGSEFDELLKLLLERGADVTLSDANRRTPLHMAYHRLYTELDEASLTQVSLMLKAHKNFEINPTSIEGISHFHIACHMLDVDVVENFLDQGDVDVNSRIDVFCNLFINASSSPLLLATVKTNWRETDSAKSLIKPFAQLRIVDSLIKHGAHVNVEDITGNTPAHYAAFVRISEENSFGNMDAILDDSPKENFLRRLVRGRADVNARNVQGETPLELLLKKKNSTLEEIQYFIACGCRFNAYNTLTGEGYVALANSQLTHEVMQRLLTWTFVNYPDSAKSDSVDRTAIHNLASIRESTTVVTQYAELFDVFTKFGYDIDDQDSLGRTALHLAAQSQHKSAVAALLFVGADLNLTDHDGKTPFAYVFEPCSRCNSPDSNHTQYSHFQLFKIFVTQIQRMQLCNLDLHKSNEHLLSETFKKFNPDTFASNHDKFLREVAKMSELKMKPYSLNVTDFISDADAVIDYPLMPLAKRRTINDFFRTNKSHFEKEFKEACGIFQLQYRQAVLRRKIINDAKDAVSILVGFRMPDICSHIIIRFLRNSELQSLILSTSLGETTKMDVDC